MNSPKKPIYSWDACVFLAWLKGDACHPLADIERVLNQVENDRALLTVSVSAYAEILCGDLPSQAADDLLKFLRHPNVTLLDVNMSIASKAASMRNAGLHGNPKRSLKLPDAYVIANAILTNSHVLHTVDDALLKLSGLPIVDGLAITKPQDISGQTILFSPSDTTASPPPSSQ